MPDDLTPTPPSISDDGLSFYRERLNDQSWCQQFPAEAAALRSSVGSALAETGQSLDLPTDPRTLVEKLADRQILGQTTPRTAADYDGVDEGGEALLVGLQIDPILGRAIVRDMLGNTSAPDPEQLARQFERAGIDYQQAIKQAAFALQRAGSQMKATDLPAFSLAHLSEWGSRLQRRQG